MGAITGCVVGLIYKNLYLGIIICLAIIGNLIIAGIFGLLIPLILDKIKMDPALSSSIFLTATTDTLGFLVFLGLAKLFLPHLILKIIGLFNSSIFYLPSKYCFLVQNNIKYT